MMLKISLGVPLHKTGKRLLSGMFNNEANAKKQVGWIWGNS